MYMTILVAVFVLLGTAASVIYYIRHRVWREFIAALALVGMLAFMVSMAAQLVLLQYVSQVEYEHKMADLVSMQITEKGVGIFVVRTRSLSLVNYYMVYALNSDGSVSPYDIPISPFVKLYEKEDLIDSGSWSEVVRENDYSGSLGKWLWFHPAQRWVVGHKIEVPKDSIKQKFDLN